MSRRFARCRECERSSQMTNGGQLRMITVAILMALPLMASKADAAQCGSSAAGFEGWKRQFADEARGKGVSASTLAALMAANYATATIAADRNQGSMHLSLDQFLARRGSSDTGGGALSSTANSLKGHGWRAGAGYKPGEANFAAIQAWNAAPVYQRAIAIIGRQIDGG